MSLKTYSLESCVINDLEQDAFPTVLRTWNCDSIELPDAGTHFGYVYEGYPHLIFDNFTYPLRPGVYFALPSGGVIRGHNSAGIIATRLNYHGVFSLAGPVEVTGRFAYIDGGTNSPLIPPIMLGDPCLNAMYFPPHINQTMHTHPSYRIGIVVEGEAEFETPDFVTHVKPGTVFLIPANSLHKFRTIDSKLTAVMFHPDSENGFTHRDNPMLKRTIVNGVSAAELPEIQTAI